MDVLTGIATAPIQRLQTIHQISDSNTYQAQPLGLQASSTSAVPIGGQKNQRLNFRGAEWTVLVMFILPPSTPHVRDNCEMLESAFSPQNMFDMTMSHVSTSNYFSAALNHSKTKPHAR
ncbi:hypothetical protein D9615_007094 [Tricholomella constricta]|uniref:Uncharacterized protein n=1 Tax=Tricholomella constricta TaxID=117010 RepID=A0A8H5H8B1_9AGAR|nr:hypothetical protein D9615_007094 [Tricholomella constricta]